MEGYGAETYGRRIADVYDDLYGELFDVDAIVAVLAGIAGDAPALELAIGTGRIALPLIRAGVNVSGIDISEEMVAKMRAKSGGSDVDVTMGNFADVDVEGRFGLIFIVFNTLFALGSQDEQLRCFRNVAEHLADDGAFVVEAFVPDVTRYERHQTVSVEEVDSDTVMLDASRHDPVAQRVDSQHVVLRATGIELYPVSIRYAYPAELDLMARLAGLELRHRWGGWHNEPFNSESKFHVSVYARSQTRSHI